MQKYKKVILSVIVILVVSLTISYVWRNFGNFKSIRGYEAYISDCDDGYDDIPYFGTCEGWYDDADARKYYNKNKRIWKNFLITDYKEGICINRYYGFSNNITIPETICGKPVVKIDGYLHKEYWTSTEFNYEIISAFANIHNATLNLPSTIKYISDCSIYEFTGMLEDDVWVKSPHIVKINVASDNPYYSSENGVLYTKDKKTLLYFNYSNEDYNPSVVPSFVEVFAPKDGIYDGGSISFGKNIKKIQCRLLDEEGCDIMSGIEEGYIKGAEKRIYGYKGTVVEEWAKEYNAKFIPVDK